jgi:hypothetical protein
MRTNLQILATHPQKRPFLRTNLPILTIHPQKCPFLRMNLRILQSFLNAEAFPVLFCSDCATYHCFCLKEHQVVLQCSAVFITYRPPPRVLLLQWEVGDFLRARGARCSPKEGMKTHPRGISFAPEALGVPHGGGFTKKQDSTLCCKKEKHQKKQIYLFFGCFRLLGRLCRFLFFCGGERGIRTPGTLMGSTVFETAPFDRSGISPFMWVQVSYLKNQCPVHHPVTGGSSGSGCADRNYTVVRSLLPLGLAKVRILFIF